MIIREVKEGGIRGLTEVTQSIKMRIKDCHLIGRNEIKKVLRIIRKKSTSAWALVLC